MFWPRFKQFFNYCKSRFKRYIKPFIFLYNLKKLTSSHRSSPFLVLYHLRKRKETKSPEIAHCLLSLAIPGRKIISQKTALYEWSDKVSNKLFNDTVIWVGRVIVNHVLFISAQQRSAILQRSFCMIPFIHNLWTAKKIATSHFGNELRIC